MKKFIEPKIEILNILDEIYLLPPSGGETDVNITDGLPTNEGTGE